MFGTLRVRFVLRSSEYVRTIICRTNDKFFYELRLYYMVAVSSDFRLVAAAIYLNRHFATYGFFT